jgi:hypothetical protein
MNYDSKRDYLLVKKIDLAAVTHLEKIVFVIL